MFIPSAHPTGNTNSTEASGQVGWKTTAHLGGTTKGTGPMAPKQKDAEIVGGLKSKIRVGMFYH